MLVSGCFSFEENYHLWFIVDEICSAAALLMGQTSESIPVVIIRGLKYDVEEIPLSKLCFSRRDLFLAFAKG